MGCVGRVVRHWSLRINDIMTAIVIVNVLDVVVSTVQPADKEHSKHHAQDGVGHDWG